MIRLSYSTARSRCCCGTIVSTHTNNLYTILQLVVVCLICLLQPKVVIGANDVNVADYTATVIVSALGVYSGPSGAYTRLDILSFGDEVTVTHNNGNWRRIKYQTSSLFGSNTQTGYVVGSKLSNTGGSGGGSGQDVNIADYKACVKTSKLGVYNGPSGGTSRVYLLSKGDVVTVTHKNGNNWVKIKYTDTTSLSLFNIENTGYVIANNIQRGTSCAVTGGGGDVNVADYKASITRSKLGVYSLPSSTSTRKDLLSYGHEVTVTHTNGNWKKIKYTTSSLSLFSKTGYVIGTGVGTISRPADVNVADYDAIVTTTTNLNVRNGPGTNYQVVATLIPNDVVTVTHHAGNWAKIRFTYNFNTIQGYVSRSYIEKQPSETNVNDYDAIVTAISLNIRSGPGTSYQIDGSLAESTFVVVTHHVGTDWAKILYYNSFFVRTTGYVHRNHIKRESPDINVADYTAVVTASSLNLRSGPATSYRIKDTLYKDDVVTVTHHNGNWAWIEYGSTTGYVQQSFIIDEELLDDDYFYDDDDDDNLIDDFFGSGDVNVADYTVSVTASKLNVRVGPGTGYAIINTLDFGDVVTVTHHNGNWARIEYTILFVPLYGYVSRTYIEEHNDDDDYYYYDDNYFYN